MIKIILVFFIIAFSESYGLLISNYEHAVLEQFFHQMILNSEAGYVLNNAKPVCTNGFHVTDEFLFGGSDRHKQQVDLREGATIWKKYFQTDLNRDIIIHVYDQPDFLYDQFYHILFINKSLFLKTVEQNLPLFQYVLGVSVTPEKLLRKLTDSKETFNSVLKGDKVLVGILLGFGTQNSLYGSRSEYIEHFLFTKEEPPLKNKLLRSDRHYQKNMLFWTLPGGFPLHPNKIESSFSGKSIQEELIELNSLMTVASPNLLKKHPQFFFCHLQDQESNKLIQKLEEVQKEIQDSFSSDFTLQKVLDKFLPGEKMELPLLTSIYDVEPGFTQNEIDQLPALIAMNILYAREQEKEEFNEAFMQGFSLGIKDADLNIPKRYEYTDVSSSEIKILLEIQKNLIQACQYLSKLSQEEAVKCISPQYIYYKCLKNGSGKELKDYAKVTVNCKIETPFEVVVDTWKEGKTMQVDLVDTIDGFAHGMNGMQEGEIREIYIHPSVGYGIYTTLEKGIYLKAKVELLAIVEQQNSPKFENLLIEQFDEQLVRLWQADPKEIEVISGYHTGYDVWDHYKIGKDYSLEQVLKAFSSLQNDKTLLDYESFENQALLNRLHWSIYRASEKIKREVVKD